MKVKQLLAIGITASFILVSVGAALSQVPVLPKDPITGTEMDAEVQWVWGEVVSVDTKNQEFMVKTLDYETDQEKEMTIGVDDKTAFENIKSLDEVKPKDNLSVDYVVTNNNKNLAKNISLEKPEELGMPEPVTPATPEVSAPPEQADPMQSAPAIAPEDPQGKD